MSSDASQRPSVDELTERMLASYESDARTRHIDAGVFPDRACAIELIDLLRDLLFPGYFTGKILTAQNVKDHTASVVARVREAMEYLVAQALTYHARQSSETAPENPTRSTFEITDAFFERIPEIRRLLGTDVQAAFDGDPAARNIDETVYTYPGVLAVFTHRVAHALYQLGVPLLPRLMSEHVHQTTGVDIHPGASIGESFFIDHGTGVVIGQTAILGQRVKLYQGVTLGAMSFPKDGEGRLIRDTKRHPTLEDDVTVYANATILGGNTVVGRGSIVGGSVFLTKSVPPGHYVTLKSQDLRYRAAEVHDRLVIERRNDEA